MTPPGWRRRGTHSSSCWRHDARSRSQKRTACAASSQKCASHGENQLRIQVELMTKSRVKNVNKQGLKRQTQASAIDWSCNSRHECEVANGVGRMQRDSQERRKKETAARLRRKADRRKQVPEDRSSVALPMPKTRHARGPKTARSIRSHPFPHNSPLAIFAACVSEPMEARGLAMPPCTRQRSL